MNKKKKVKHNNHRNIVLYDEKHRQHRKLNTISENHRNESVSISTTRYIYI